MSDAFDLDCPNTPDDGDGIVEGRDKTGGRGNGRKDDAKNIVDGNEKSSRSRTTTSSSTRSSNATQIAPVRFARSTSSSSSRVVVVGGGCVGGGATGSSSRVSRSRAGRVATFAPRPRSATRASSSSTTTNSGGLEPEEYIAPPTTMPSSSSSRRAGGGGGGGVIAGGGTNPFDSAGYGGGGRGGGGDTNRGRTYSGNLWREEIIDEGDDKATKYYGLNLHVKHGLYGPSATTESAPVAIAANNAVDVELGVGQVVDRSRIPSSDSSGGGGGGMSILRRRDMHDHGIIDNQNVAIVNGINPHGPLNASVYHRAAIVNGAGYYTTHGTNDASAPHAMAAAAAAAVDDYSFSNVDLGHMSRGGTDIRRDIPPGTSNANITTGGGGTTFRDKLLQWCVRALTETSSSIDNDRREYIRPGVHHPDELNKMRGVGPTRRLGYGLLWMVLISTIFGVTISELKKANAATRAENEDSQLNGLSSTMGVQLPPPAPEMKPSLEPTLSPTFFPTEEPTTSSPSKMPVTDSPIASNYAIHSKTSREKETDPTESPVSYPKYPKPPPTHEPSAYPTGTPTVAVASVRSNPGGSGSCIDNNDGLFLNHLGNPFNCTWLYNGKAGKTDRKDKNCGGVPVVDEVNGGTMVYETSELGKECKATCSWYNGCDADPGDDKATNDSSGMTPMSGHIITPKLFDACQDSQGHFLNHLSNPMTCEWLYNDKPGRTDRKDKNCGTSDHPVTELGRACKSTCSIYNGGECAGGEATDSEKTDDEGDMEDTEETEDNEETDDNEEKEVKEDTEEEDDIEGNDDTEEDEDEEENEDNKENKDEEEKEVKEENDETKEVDMVVVEEEGKKNGGVEKVSSELIVMKSGQVMRSYSSPSYSFSEKIPNKDRR